MVTGSSNRLQQQEQRYKEEWTWEDILDGKGCYSWGEILAGRDHGNRWRQPGERRQQVKGASALREHGWQGSPRSSPKNVLGGGTRGVWLNQVGNLSQLPMLNMERG